MCIYIYIYVYAGCCFAVESIVGHESQQHAMKLFFQNMYLFMLVHSAV